MKFLHDYGTMDICVSYVAPNCIIAEYSVIGTGQTNWLVHTAQTNLPLYGVH